VRKQQQGRKTGRESQRTIRRLLTVYQRQINHQQEQITALENHIRAQELRVKLLQGIRRASTSTLELFSSESRGQKTGLRCLLEMSPSNRATAGRSSRVAGPRSSKR
jgi:hypothetical protein